MQRIRRCLEIAMHSAGDILSLWPRDADVARDIGAPYQTVSAWRRRGTIPPSYWQKLLTAARRRGLSQLTTDVLAGIYAMRSQAEAGASKGRKSGKTPDLSPGEVRQIGHFSRFRHLRRAHFSTSGEIDDHIRALREEWDRR